MLMFTNINVWLVKSIANLQPFLVEKSCGMIFDIIFVLNIP